MTTPDWTHAACKLLPDDEAEELFFPPPVGGRGVNAFTQRAKQICKTCPILSDCREWALTHPDLASSGTWGGLTAAERTNIIKNRRVA